MARFVEKRRWSGLVRVKIKKTGRVFYFDCVLNAIVSEDEVVGVSAQRERGLRTQREHRRRVGPRRAAERADPQALAAATTATSRSARRRSLP